MVTFINDHRAVYGVEPICRVLPIAPSTYYTHAARLADPKLMPARAKRDASLSDEIRFGRDCPLTQTLCRNDVPSHHMKWCCQIHRTTFAPRRRAESSAM